MRGKRAKQLRRIAEENTIGQPDAVTRKEYQKRKKEFKESRR